MFYNICPWSDVLTGKAHAHLQTGTFFFLENLENILMIIFLIKYVRLCVCMCVCVASTMFVHQ
jgi:hypothetical protein